jgi:hypothetical protein
VHVIAGSIVGSTVGSTVSSTVTGSTVNSTVAHDADGSVPGPLPDHDEEADTVAQDTDELDEESDDMTPTPELDAVFRRTYSNFESNLKWKLPSGSTAEDILYAAYWSKTLRPSVRELIRNGIVDLGSEKVQALFSESDWAAIKAEIPPLPEVNHDFARSLLRFSKVYSLASTRTRIAGKLIYPVARQVKTTTDLRKVVETTSYKSADVPYDRARHFDMDWAELVIRQMFITVTPASILTCRFLSARSLPQPYPISVFAKWVRLGLYEDADIPLRGQHLEDWYCYNIWSDIIDKCFRSLQRVILERYILSSSISPLCTFF